MKLLASFLVPIAVSLALFHPKSSDVGKGMTLVITIVFCTATAIETFTQDDKK